MHAPSFQWRSSASKGWANSYQPVAERTSTDAPAQAVEHRLRANRIDIGELGQQVEVTHLYAPKRRHHSRQLSGVSILVEDPLEEDAAPADRTDRRLPDLVVAAVVGGKIPLLLEGAEQLPDEQRVPTACPAHVRGQPVVQLAGEG